MDTPRGPAGGGSVTLRPVSWERELGATELFAGVPANVLQEIASRAVHRRYRKGTILFVQGEHAPRCYVVLTGSVKNSVYSTDGKEAVIAINGPGVMFGELALFDDAPRSADAIVIEDSEILSIDKETVTGAALTHPEFGLALLQALARRLRLATGALHDASFLDVPGRVARRLADLAEAYGTPTDDGTVIEMPLSQEGLASMVGATRESVNKALASLTRRGLVTRRGRKYVVSDVAQLRERAR